MSDLASLWHCDDLDCQFNSPSINEIEQHGKALGHVGAVDTEHRALLEVRAGKR